MSTLNAYSIPPHLERVNIPCQTKILDTHSEPNVGPRTQVLVSLAEPRGWATIADTGQLVYLLDGKIIEGPPGPEVIAAFAPEAAKDSPVVCFGAGCGQQIHMIRGITGAPILVFEPDPGILRRFLGLGFSLPGVSLVSDMDEFREMFGAFLKGSSSATVLAQKEYVEAFPHEHAEFMDLFRRILDAEHVTMQTIEHRMPEWIRHTLTNMRTIAGAKSAMHLAGAFAGVPAFIVGAGPSLERNWELLQECKRKGIVIAIDVVGRALDLRGFEPDFILTVEARDISAKLAGVSWLSHTPRLWTLACHPTTFALGEGPMLVWADSNAPYRELCEQVLTSEGLPIGGSCTTAAELFAEAFGCNPIVMVGNDLANVQEGDRPNHVTGVDIDGLVHRHQEQGTVQPWGQAGEPLRDSPIWRHARVWFEQRAVTLARDNPGVQLVNASEGGSHVDGWEDTRLADVLQCLPDRQVDVAATIRLLDPIRGEAVQEWLTTQANALEAAIPFAEQVAAFDRAAAGSEWSEATMATVVQPALDDRNRAEQTFRGMAGDLQLFAGWTQREIKAMFECQKALAAAGAEHDAAVELLLKDASAWDDIASKGHELVKLLRGEP